MGERPRANPGLGCCVSCPWLPVRSVGKGLVGLEKWDSSSPPPPPFFLLLLLLFFSSFSSPFCAFTCIYGNLLGDFLRDEISAPRLQATGAHSFLLLWSLQTAVNRGKNASCRNPRGGRARGRALQLAAGEIYCFFSIFFQPRGGVFVSGVRRQEAGGSWGPLRALCGSG